jgi:hypothetical protein
MEWEEGRLCLALYLSLPVISSRGAVAGVSTAEDGVPFRLSSAGGCRWPAGGTLKRCCDSRQRPQLEVAPQHLPFLECAFTPTVARRKPGLPAALASPWPISICDHFITVHSSKPHPRPMPLGAIVTLLERQPQRQLQPAVLESLDPARPHHSHWIKNRTSWHGPDHIVGRQDIQLVLPLCFR